MAFTSTAKPFGPFERSLSWRYLRAKRAHGGVALISIISFVGIMLAVATLIIVMSVMNGFRSDLLSRILGVDGHVFVQTDQTETLAVTQMAKQIQKLPGITHAFPVVEGQVMASADGGATGALVRGVSAGDMKTLSLISDHIVDGSLKNYDAGEDGSDHIIVGYRLAGRLGLKASDQITLVAPSGSATPFGMIPARKVYTIAGLFDSGMSEFDAAYIYMPLSQSQLFFNRGDTVDRLDVRLTDPDRSAEAMASIRKLVGSDYQILDWRARNASYVNALQIERNVMRLILMLIVAIAAMNIISGLVMLVKNKGRDIAILRTIGASSNSMLRVFFMTGAAIGVFGTIAGLILGVLFCIYIQPIQDFIAWVTNADLFNAEIYYLTRIPAKIEWSEVSIIAFWALVMSFVATLPPAWRASRLDPVEALRYE
ncbi:MAG: lipoprotein-releasing ABC transporter permease subunit [Caulobacterales bacterium]